MIRAKELTPGRYLMIMPPVSEGVLVAGYRVLMTTMSWMDLSHWVRCVHGDGASAPVQLSAQSLELYRQRMHINTLSDLDAYNCMFLPVDNLPAVVAAYAMLPDDETVDKNLPKFFSGTFNPTLATEYGVTLL